MPRNNIYHTYFTDEKTETHSLSLHSLLWITQQVAELKFDLRSV
jgi:hypothetical protein